MIAGLSHSRQGPSAALIIPGTTIAAAEESRMSRMRGASGATDPQLALAELLQFLGRTPRDIQVTASATRVPMPAGVLGTSVDAHIAHALYAVQSSGFTDALVVVCDSSAQRGYRAWKCTGALVHGCIGAESLGAEVRDVGAFRIAEAYSVMTEAVGFRRGQDEHIVESLARTGRASDTRLADKLKLEENGLAVPEGFASYFALAAELPAVPNEGSTRGFQTGVLANAVASVQERLGGALTELLTRLQAATGETRLCLAGGLFYNSYFTTIAAAHPAFDEVFVPAHPGNGGCAIGAALAMGDARLDASAMGSAFLGPSYSREQVKQTLDNCKLSYDVLPEGRVMSTVIDAITRGQLAAWFSGRMEWGPRALGHRSVLASPFSPYALENLNGFLKRRAWYRGYGVSVPQKDLEKYFTGPSPSSPFMQFEYTPRDPQLLRHILPEGATRVRVHTVTENDPRFLMLLEQWGQQAPAPILVNTSFNGFHEPLVCTPRDAVRVFYGTGLDVMAVEDFVLRK